MTPVRTLRLVAAAALAAATAAALPAAPATAATCDSSTGVSVVVDFSLLGGSVAATCVPDGGGDTAGAVTEVHHDLTRVAQFPGAVCKVDGAPADAQCQRMPPADAYWGLFWSDGTGGWVYSSEGVDSLNIPDGGSVAFAWQDGGDRDQPGIAPPQHDSEEPSPSPSPAPAPSPSPGSDGDGDGGHQGGQSGQPSSPAPTSSAPTGAASPGDAPGQDGEGGKGGKGGRQRPGDRGGPDREDAASPTPEADPSDAVPAATEPPADSGGSGTGGLPTWVAPVGIAGLFGLAGAVALLRRRSAVR